MQFLITSIVFDFTDDEGRTLSRGLQEDLVCDAQTTVGEADDEEDLIEEITCATGWRVKHIDYKYALRN